MHPANYRGQHGRVRLVSHKCDVCRGEYVLAEDARSNKREMIRFQKGIDAIPLGCEIRAMRLRASISQQQAGEIFGGGPTAFSKYESDDLIPNEAMVNLLKLAINDVGIISTLRRLQGKHVKAGYVMSEFVSAENSDTWSVSGSAAEGGDAVTDVAFRGSAGAYGSKELWTQ